MTWCGPPSCTLPCAAQLDCAVCQQQADALAAGWRAACSGCNHSKRLMPAMHYGVPCACSFYQHIVNGCEWDFGIVWGHSVSSDLIHWEHMPPALIPSEGQPLPLLPLHGMQTCARAAVVIQSGQ